MGSGARPGKPDEARAGVGILPALCIAALCLVAVGRTWPNAYVGDDKLVLYAEELPPFWGEVGEIWSRPLYRDPSIGLYRPLFSQSVFLESAVAGPRHARVSRAINFALHLAVVLLFYRFLVRIPRREGEPPGRWPVPFVGAALFAVHPWHIEPVSQLVGRADLLATLFVMLGLRLHQRGVDPLWTALCYLLGLLSKESAVVLPGLLLAYDAILLRRFRWKTYAVLLVPLAIYLGARALALGGLTPKTIFYEDDLAFRLPAVGYTFLNYLRLGLVPLGLSCDYGDLFLRFRQQGFLMAVSWAGALLALGIHLVWLARDRHRYAVFGFAFLSLGLALYVHLLPVQFYMADRFAYLASAGLALWIAALVGSLPARFAPARWALAGLMLAGWLALSIQHAPVYRTSLTVLSHSAALRPDSIFLNNQLRIIFTRSNREDLAAVHDERFRELRGILLDEARAYRADKGGDTGREERPVPAP